LSKRREQPPFFHTVTLKKDSFCTKRAEAVFFRVTGFRETETGIDHF